MLLFFIGLASGIVSGMGIGGGTILIPALFIFSKLDQHIAQSVNLLFFIPTAIISLIVHIRNKRINLRFTIPIIISGFVGVFFGSSLSLMLPGSVLKKWFGLFLFIMAIYELIGKKEKKLLS